MSRDQKIWWHDSKHIVDVVMLPKFGIKRIYHNLNFIRIWPGKKAYEGWSWFKLNNLRLALGMILKFYTSVENRLKVEVIKFQFLIPTFVQVTEKKLVSGLSNSSHFTSANKCRRESRIINFTSAKMKFASAILKKCIFANIQLKGVVNRLPLFQNLSNHTNRFSVV